MNPRIFVSSTFYDLKYAREDLGNFIEGFGFEAIRSEVGSIGYTPGIELDKSCYVAMRECDMAILIIGGRYGAPTSNEGEVSDNFKEFISITRQEFRTAIENNIPVFVFIESGVFAEYRLYKKNKDEIEKGTIRLEFEAVDNINILRFIDGIQLLTKVPIFLFGTILEIKNTLRLQWADMFRKYLLMLKQQTSAMHEVEPTISEIYSSIQEMKIMLQSIGQDIFRDNPGKMNDIIGDQLVELAAGKIARTFEFVSGLKDEKDIHDYLVFFVDTLYEAKKKGMLEYPFSDNFKDAELFYSMFDYKNVLIGLVKEHLIGEEEIFDESSEFKQHLVNRLLQHDYLKKMKFIA